MTLEELSKEKLIAEHEIHEILMDFFREKDYICFDSLNILDVWTEENQKIITDVKINFKIV